MVECSFCGKEINPGTGKMYIKKDGTVFNFCSSKCQKTQIDRKYKARITPWTKLFHALKAKIKK
ncbi:MAG: 50S ribosomal protein L24e [Candidatus Nanoarchaeia archaeon]|jgi:large subunit ribosomal protein L24e|nr:50S ribosomal protein L24e [Candidatus Nanoarchaeia archaeon]